MKKIESLLFIALLNVSLVVAQPPQQGKGNKTSIEEWAKKTTEWMTNELSLTQSQIAKVDSINLLFAKTQQAYFKAVDGDRDKIREAMTTLEQEKIISLSKVLTPKQIEIYKVKIQEFRDGIERKKGQWRDN